MQNVFKGIWILLFLTFTVGLFSVDQVQDERQRLDKEFNKRLEKNRMIKGIEKNDLSMKVLTYNVVNGGFESGDLTGWYKKGDAQVISMQGNVGAIGGNYMAVISNGIDSTNEYKSVVRSYDYFQVPNDANTLTVRWNFLSNEYPNYINAGYNDFFYLVVEYNGNDITLMGQTVDSANFVESGSGYNGETGWQVSYFDISAYRGKSIKIKGRVEDVGDTVVDSAALIDMIEVDGTNVIKKGYIISGTTNSPGLTNGGNDFLVYKVDENGKEIWKKNFGGSGNDVNRSICRTSDGGFLIAGYTDSYTNGGVDFYIIKVDKYGNELLLKKNFWGLAYDDFGTTVRATSDGGFILSGQSNSFPQKKREFLLYKFDKDGNKQWRENFGGLDDEFQFMSDSVVQETVDGGYIVVGGTYSWSNGSMDMMVYKLNSKGDKVNKANFGAEWYDVAYSVDQTMDGDGGGYVIAGESYSFTNGGSDILVYKLDKNLKKTGFKKANFGGIYDDAAYSIQQTSDGGYILCGKKQKSTDTDMFVVKLKQNGKKDWKYTFGGPENDVAYSIQQTAEGDYVFAGYTNSYTNGNSDFMVYKIDQYGNKRWKRNYGGTGSDIAQSIKEVSDKKGAIIVCVDGIISANTFLDWPVYQSLVVAGLHYFLGEGASYHYLKSAILSLNIGIDADIKSFNWGGDAKKTWKWVPILQDFLRKYYHEAKDQNKKFIVVSHSWGTVLSYCALSLEAEENDPTYGPLIPDLYVTMSSPLGTAFARSIPYIPIPGLPSPYGPFEKALIAITGYHYAKLIDQTPSKNPSPNVKKWYNVWAWGDYISGPLKSFSTIVEDIKYVNTWTIRLFTGIPYWHGFTTMGARKSNDWGVDNDYARQKLRQLILSIY